MMNLQTGAAREVSTAGCTGPIEPIIQLDDLRGITPKKNFEFMGLYISRIEEEAGLIKLILRDCKGESILAAVHSSMPFNLGVGDVIEGTARYSGNPMPYLLILDIHNTEQP